MRLIAATQTSRRYMRGQARGKLGTCNRMLRMPQMPKEGCFAFSDSRPTFEYSPSRWKSPLCIAKHPFSGGLVGIGRAGPKGKVTVLGRSPSSSPKGRAKNGLAARSRCLATSRWYGQQLLSLNAVRGWRWSGATRAMPRLRLAGAKGAPRSRGSAPTRPGGPLPGPPAAEPCQPEWPQSRSRTDRLTRLSRWPSEPCGSTWRRRGMAHDAPGFSRRTPQPAAGNPASELEAHGTSMHFRTTEPRSTRAPSCPACPGTARRRRHGHRAGDKPRRAGQLRHPPSREPKQRRCEPGSRSETPATSSFRSPT